MEIPLYYTLQNYDQNSFHSICLLIPLNGLYIQGFCCYPTKQQRWSREGAEMHIMGKEEKASNHWIRGHHTAHCAQNDVLW